MLTPAELLKFDAPLVALANLSGGDLRKLFYAFFAFLHTRTDFYCIGGADNDDGAGGGAGGRMGFREGQAEQILLASFRQFPLRRVAPPKPKPKPKLPPPPPHLPTVDEDLPGSPRGGGDRPGAALLPSSLSSSTTLQGEDAPHPPPPAGDVVDGVDEETTTTTSTTLATSASNADTDAAVVVPPRSTSASAAVLYTDEGKPVTDDDNDDNVNDADADADEGSTTTSTTAASVGSNADTNAAVAPPLPSGTAAISTWAVRYTDEGKQVPVGNGGSTSRYVWTQTLEEVTVHVPLPDGVRARDLDVRICANTLSIRRKKKGGGTQHSDDDNNDDDDDDDVPPLEGTLFARVRPSESTWTLESNDDAAATYRRPVATLQLILEKVQRTWWETVMSGDGPLIDTTMVDSTRHIGTYDDETQAEIRRIMHDQRQELLGLPTLTAVPGGSDPLPPIPETTGGKGKYAGGATMSLPAGVEYIDGATLDRAFAVGDKKNEC
jgi:hypothetical protein